MEQKRWDELMPDQKADLIHRENRQLYELLNEQVKRITILDNEIRKIKRALDIDKSYRSSPFSSFF